MRETRQAVMLTGPPGSGKSTILQNMQRGMRGAAIETGRLLREQAEKKTFLGEELRPSLEKGQLAPTKLVNRVDRRGDPLRRRLPSHSQLLSSLSFLPRNHTRF